MAVVQRNIEELLRHNVNELAQDLAREFGLACKKAGIYGPDHPAALKAAEKPFLALRRFFDFRRVMPLHLMRGKLTIAQIQLKETHLTDQFVQYVQMLDIFGILFDEKVSIRDLSVFLNLLTRRENRFATRFDMAAALTAQGVPTIEVNSERAMKFFENRKQYRGEIAGDYTVRHLLREQFPDDPLALARLWKPLDSRLEDESVDYRASLVSHLLPEKIAAIPQEVFSAALTRSQSDIASHNALQGMAAFHPERHRLVSSAPAADSQPAPLDQISLIRREALTQLQQALTQGTSINASASDLQAIAQSFERVLKTGQAESAEQSIAHLFEALSSPEVAVRRQHVQVLDFLLSRDAGYFSLAPFTVASATLARHLRERTESFEHGEIGVALISRFIGESRYAELLPIAEALESRVDRMLGVTTVDSPIVKRLRDTFHDTTRLNTLVQQALRTSNVARESQQAALQLLIALRSEEVAAALADQISHPERAVRQAVLKTLGEMGGVAESVCISLVQQVRHLAVETVERWYKLRNALHVLGHLRSNLSVDQLRPLVDDPDARVRAEFVLCLEKIRGDESLDLLLELATDPDKDVRARASAALGAVGNPSVIAPITKILSDSADADQVRLIASLGRIGGAEAKQYLFSLLNDEEAGKTVIRAISKDELRAAVIRALGAMADPEALVQVKRFSDSIPFTQRLLLRSSLVGEALSEVLERH